MAHLAEQILNTKKAALKKANNSFADDEFGYYKKPVQKKQSFKLDISGIIKQHKLSENRSRESIGIGCQEETPINIDRGRNNKSWGDSILSVSIEE